MLTFQAILPYLILALIALPLPILFLVKPTQHIYERYLRYKYYNMVKKYCENPYGVDEEQLSKLFPGAKAEKLEEMAYYLEEELVYKAD